MRGTNRELLVEYILAGQADFYRLAYSYVKNRDGALDVVQESIAKALEKCGTLREVRYVKTWFYRILINESMNYFRRNRRLLEYEEAMDGVTVAAEDVGARLDLWDGIGRLKREEQLVIQLRYFEDMKLEEIAEVTGTNINTVKSRLYKSIRRLKEITGEGLEDE